MRSREREPPTSTSLCLVASMDITPLSIDWPARKRIDSLGECSFFCFVLFFSPRIVRLTTRRNVKVFPFISSKYTSD